MMSLASNTKNRNEGVVAVVDTDDKNRTARSVLKKLGFDLDDLNKESRINNWSVTPIIYFSSRGNVTMVRYLVSHGADCRKPDEVGRSPLFWAAVSGHVEIVKFLYYDGGAREDIRTQVSVWSPLRVALLYYHFDLVHWLIPHGALTPLRADVEDGGIDDMVLRRDFRQDEFWREDKRRTVFLRAQTAVTTHDNFHLFLKGTILAASTFRRHPNNKYATRSNKRIKLAVTTATTATSPLVLFKGKAGILELISKYVGLLPPRDLYTFRQLMVLLPAFIKDVPF